MPTRRHRSSQGLEVGGERHPRQVALQIVPVTLPPIGGVHHPVQVLPDVVLGDGAVAIVVSEVVEAPVGDVVVVVVLGREADPGWDERSRSWGRSVTGAAEHWRVLPCGGRVEDEACRTSSSCMTVTVALPYHGGQGIRRLLGPQSVRSLVQQARRQCRSQGEDGSCTSGGGESVRCEGCRQRCAGTPHTSRPGLPGLFGQDGGALIILLGGGTKARRQRDIESARELWQEYKHRKKQELKVATNP